MGAIISVLGKVLLGMGMKLVAAEVVEELLIWVLGRLVLLTDSKVDDELLELVKKHLED